MNDTLSVEFAKAIVRVQGQIEGAKKGSLNPAFRSKYADLGAVWDACTDALQNNDVAVLQFPCKASEGHVGLRTMLVYGPTGETLEESFEVPLKDATNPQAMGSALTYARRYSLSAIVGVRVCDDDGNAASSGGKAGPPKAQAGRLQESKPAGLNASEYQAKFDALRSVAERKALYTEVKNSGLMEPYKTAVLAAWAKSIKAESASTISTSTSKENS